MKKIVLSAAGIVGLGVLLYVLYGLLAEPSNKRIAPEIVGKDIDGVSFKLSDYRGKVVVLDFWGYWCPHCVAMIPHERTLVKRLEGQPFALIGVNTDNDRDEVKAQNAVKGVTWRSFFDSSSGGPICQAWKVSSFPAIFVIDHKGVIRFTGVRGEAMDRAVDKLLAEMKSEKQ